MTFMNLIAFLCLAYASLVFGAPECGSDKFSCTHSNPCSPLYVAGQNKYPALFVNKWVQCDNQGGCSEHRCPPESYYNSINQRCEDVNGIEARCALDHNDCDQRNPCSPTLCTRGLKYYPGKKENKYVSCDASGGCSVICCPRRLVWDQTTQQCILKSAIPPPTTTPPPPPITTPAATNNRCDGPHFDCANNDPCSPTKCTNNGYYPMVDPRDFISCQSTTCKVNRCPQLGNGLHFSDVQQTCVSN